MAAERGDERLAALLAGPQPAVLRLVARDRRGGRGPRPLGRRVRRARRRPGGGGAARRPRGHRAEHGRRPSSPRPRRRCARSISPTRARRRAPALDAEDADEAAPSSPPPCSDVASRPWRPAPERPALVSSARRWHGRAHPARAGGDGARPARGLGHGRRRRLLRRRRHRLDRRPPGPPLGRHHAPGRLPGHDGRQAARHHRAGRARGRRPRLALGRADHHRPRVHDPRPARPPSRRAARIWRPRCSASGRRRSSSRP